MREGRKGLKKLRKEKGKVHNVRCCNKFKGRQDEERVKGISKNKISE